MKKYNTTYKLQPMVITYEHLWTTFIPLMGGNSERLTGNANAYAV